MSRLHVTATALLLLRADKKGKIGTVIIDKLSTQEPGQKKELDCVGTKDIGDDEYAIPQGMVMDSMTISSVAITLLS